MRFLLILILLCVAPFAPSYANQEVAEAIKRINLQGISMQTPMSDVSGILTSRGFVKDEVNSRAGSILYFRKGECSLMFAKNYEGNLPRELSYKCKKSDADVEM